MKGFVLSLLFLGLLIVGCTQPGSQPSSLSQPTQTYACPDGSIVTNLSSCERQACSDGTAYGSCSSTKPRYCSNGQLIDRASTCGCGIGIPEENGSCSTCVPRCVIDADCYDADSDTTDKCLNPNTCEARCENAPINVSNSTNVPCSGYTSDSICPPSCTNRSDIDCIKDCSGTYSDYACPATCNAINDIDCPLCKTEEFCYSKDKTIKMYVSSICHHEDQEQEIDYEIYNLGNSSLHINNWDYLARCSTHPIKYANCLFQTEAFQYDIPPGSKYSATGYYRGCLENGIFMYDPTGFSLIDPEGDALAFDVGVE